MLILFLDIQFIVINKFRLGDSERKISLLKLDVEGEEFESMPQILQSKVLRNVDQIHLEVKHFI